MDLPPQNSFARLLAHKLADYYSLAHHINDDGTSIRIFRTPSISLYVPYRIFHSTTLTSPSRPTSLATLAKSIPIGSVQPPGPALKIMRRAGLGARQLSAGGSTAASSSAPSKATSEAGFETTSDEGLLSPMDGTPNRDDSKLTREEREARYKAARERIFGDFQETTSESASTGENSASMSRSSSSSGKRKSRKHKTPKDDSFEARSAFIPSYTPVHMSSMQPQFNPQYVDQSYQQGYAGSPGNYATNMNYGTTPTQAYPGFDQAMSYNGSVPYNGGSQQAFTNADNWQSMQPTSPNGYFMQSQNQSGYQQGLSPMMNPSSNPFMQQQSPQMPSSNWMNNQIQNPYQQQNNVASTNAAHWGGYNQGPAPNMPNNPSYQYGQLPPSSFANNAPFNAQHPLPGSFSRSLFNPQTRSFVPSNASSRSGGRTSRKKNSPSTSQNRNSQPLKPYSGSDSSTSTRIHDAVSSTNNPAAPSPKPTKEASLQSRYGAPAHLPKKPPPSQIPSTFDVESINGASTPGGSGPLLGNVSAAAGN